MSKTVNILGSTQKEQWLTAISIYDLSVGANIEEAMQHLAEGWEEDEQMRESLETARRVLADYTNEMRRLVEGVFE